MANELTLSVNGAKQVVSVPPEMPLLFVLRNELKLTSPHMGCGMAQCGACAILLDAAVRVLPKRNDDCRRAIAGKKSEPDRRGDQGCIYKHTAVAASVSLRYLRRDH